MTETPPTTDRRILLAPPAVTALIVLLVAIHGLLALGGEEWQAWAYQNGAFIPARFGPLPYASPPGAVVWTFLTYALLHGSWMHVLFNCAWLLVFGTPVARQLGTTRFLVLQLIAAIGGAGAMLVSFWGEDVVVIGASGAVSGLMAAAVPVMFARRIATADGPAVAALSPLELLFSRKAMGFMVVTLVTMVAAGVSNFGLSGSQGDNTVAWQAHVGGFVAGLVAFYLLGGGRVRALAPIM